MMLWKKILLMAILDKYFLLPASCLICVTTLPQRKDLRVVQVCRTSFCISLLGFSDCVTMNAVMQALGEAIIISRMG